MNDFDMVPSGGDLQPFNPQTPLSPSPSPGGMPDYLIPETDQPYPPDAPLPGQLFGVPVPGATGQQIESLILRPVVNDFLAEMRRLGIPAKYSTAAANWLLVHAFTLPSWEAAAHHYSIAGIPVSEADMPYVVSFLNEMARVDADPPTVRIFLSYWWQRAPQVLENLAAQHQQPSTPSGGVSIDRLSDRELQFLLKYQPQNQQRTKDRLRNLWGNAYEHRLQLAGQFFSQLPEQDRHFFESTICFDGTAPFGYMVFGDTVEAITYCYQQAVAAAKPSVKVENLAGEIQIIEDIMRNDRKRYDRDLALQERLRALYALRDGE